MSNVVRWRPGLLLGILAALGMLAAVACGPAAAPTPTPTKAPAAPTATATTAPAPAVATPTRAPGVTPVLATPTPTTAVPPTPTPTKAAQPKKGGTWAYTVNAVPPHHDFRQASTSATYEPWIAVGEGLLEDDPKKDGVTVGALAESWDLSADGTVWTFRLRKNVKWHDGKPFSSADVVATFEQQRNPPATGFIAFRKSWFTQWESVQAPDPNTVVIKLKSPDPSTVIKLRNNQGDIVPKHILDAKGDVKQDLIGTGAFRLKSKESQSYLYERNPDYYLPGLPYLDGLTMFVISDLDTAFAALRTGRLTHFGTDQEMNSERLEVINRDYKNQMTVGVLKDRGSLREVVMHWDLPADNPFNKIEVRKAVALAIDKKDAAAVAYAGLVTTWGPATVQVRTVWAPTDAQLREWEPLGYTDRPMSERIADAKKLLTQAGYPTGFTTEMLVRNHVRFTPMGIYAKDALSKIGITLNLNVLENVAAQAKAKEPRGFIMYIGSGSAPDPFTGWPDRLLPGGGFNFGNREDKVIIDLYQKLLRAKTLEEEKQIVWQGEKHILGDYYRIPVGSDEVMVVWWNYVRDWQPGGASSVYGRWWKYAWFDK
ncbi:MAG: ABC transporter substrate-binding protein [Chloroflexi bacterium]|nr:ABC transporter substrate-binding protein [Chloroflexota bacterium]